MNRVTFALALCLASGLAPAAAQEAAPSRPFSLAVKTGLNPLAGVAVRVAGPFSVRALGAVSASPGVDGVGTLALLYAPARPGPLGLYGGLNLTAEDFVDPILLGVLGGAAYRLGERFSVFGEIGVDVNLTEAGSAVRTFNSTGVGVALRL